MVLVKLSILNFLLAFINSYNHNSDDDYFKNQINVRVRTNFLDKKVQNEKIKLFDKIYSNKTVYVENILHLYNNYAIPLNIEESFRYMLAMIGMKYIYKRDFFWRTWRQVQTNGNVAVVCYRCQNRINGTCQNGGYWVIEEKPPPCTYEIFSLKTDLEICVINYNQYPVLNGSCQSVINRIDLKSACDNPIKTRWRINRKYDEISGRNHVNVICQGRENCDISTVYTILPDMIVFKIINSTNHIIFSKVMKSGFNNYICIEDCGRIDLKTDLVSKNKEPFRLDLFKKNKREDFWSMSSLLPVKNKKYSKLNSLLGLHLEIKKDKITCKKNEPKHYLFNVKNKVNKSACQILEEKYFENENNRDYK